MRDVAERLLRLDGWLETMRQAGGYGGPVVHWWQHSTRYCAPGLDWRYEGILVGYSDLFGKTRESEWRFRLERAADDLVAGQRQDGSYRASGFERNPSALGTPHEAAASLGLLHAVPLLPHRGDILGTVRRNLENLITRLWDGAGFNDRPGVPGRVPNKLATLAHALLLFGERTEHEELLPYARAALDDVVRFQVARGRAAGAIHQFASGPRADRTDGRFFPYYNARCVPPLLVGARVLGRSEYRDCAEAILDFLERSMDRDGSWPQIVYASGRVASGPRWLAGTADILLAFDDLRATLPHQALSRLLDAQLPSGGFPTAEGFGARTRGRDWRDLLPVVGWNDKVLRLLARLVPAGVPFAVGEPAEADLPVMVGPTEGRLFDRPHEVMVVAGEGALHYRWRKAEPWARHVTWEAGIR